MKQKLRYLDFKILVPYIILNLTGIIMIYSASSYNLTEQGKTSIFIGAKQAMFFIVCLGIIAFIYKTKTQLYRQALFQKIIIGVSIVLLLSTSVLGLGSTTGGAQRWLNLGIINLQPSEFVMITVILYSSFIFSRRQEKIQHHFREMVLAPTLVIAVLIGLVLFQPNVGGAAILTMIYLILLLASGIPYLYMATSFGITLVFSFIMTQLVLFKKGLLVPQRFAHVYDRFSVVKDPFSDQLDNGFQLINSYYAIYNGGWFGRGLGQSIQKKGFLPVAETDFIFSVTVEELGLIMSLIILGILFFLILRIIAVGINAQSAFNSLTCIGIGSAILIQVFVNLGGILTIIPMTGVPFPFMSYGGSNLLTMSVMIGIALNISAEEKRLKYGLLQLELA